MKRMIPFCACALAFVLPCCTNAAPRGQVSSAHEASIVGTVLDAASGVPEAHVRVEGPGGKSARSDSNGRFILSGFDLGTDGEVTARADDGRTASVRLRHLGAGRLEIVLQLAGR